MLACLFWTVQLLSGFRRNDRAKRFLTLFMGVATVLYACHWVYFNRVAELIPVADAIHAFCTLSVYPLYFIYIKLLTSPRGLRASDFLFLVPAVTSCVLCAIFYTLEMDAAQVIRQKATGAVLALQIIPILWLGGRRVARYNREISDYYSNTEGKTFSYIRRLLAFFVATSLSSFVFNIIGKDYFVGSVWTILAPALIFSVLLYALGYIGNRQNFTAEDFAREVARDEPLGPAADTGPEPSDLAVSVRKLIESGELYRQPDIKISDLAAMLGTNRTYISAALNRDLGMSFSTLMNAYRVEYAKRLMADSAAGRNTLTRNEIIERSGFAHRSSFHRAFRTVTGKAPRETVGE